MKKSTNYLATIRNFLSFCLNANARLYGYAVDYDAEWSQQRQYLKDILELELGTIFDDIAPNTPKHYALFIEYANDMDCIFGVLHHYDYHADYALENMVSSKDKRKSESAKVDIINDLIYKILYS